MTKQEVQARVLKNGKPIDLELFSWDEETNTFSSDEDNLTLDFYDVDGMTFYAGWNCVFSAGSNCIFNTNSNCIFKTRGHCTFNAGSNCIFNTNSNCIFNFYEIAYIINQDINNVATVLHNNKETIYSLDTFSKEKFLQLTSYSVIEREIKNFELVDGEIMIKLSLEKNVDDMNVYRSQFIDDYFSDDGVMTYVAKENELAAHGYNLKDAIKSVIFKKLYSQGVDKNSKRIVKNGKMTMDDYRLLTGSCEIGTKRFLDEQGITYDTVMSIEDAINLVKKEHAYRHEIFIKNLKEAGYTV